MKAMILAAGMGTRLKPWTDNHPKALALINGRSLLERNVKYLQQFDIYELIVNVHHFADQVVDAIEEGRGWGSNIIISDERDALLETGGGIKKAAFFFHNEPCFLLMNADVLTNLTLNELIDFHNYHRPLATLATTGRKTSRYFLFDEADVLCGWRNVQTGAEKIARPSANYFPRAFSGIHILSNNIFEHLNYFEGKFSMVDVYLEAAKKVIIKSFDHSNSKFIDVGKPESIITAETLFA